MSAEWLPLVSRYPAHRLREQIAVALAGCTAYERAGDPLRIADAVLALPALRKLAAAAEERAEIAPLLRTVAAGRREYMASIREDEPNPALRERRQTLEVEALTLEAAAKIAEGDTGPLYGLLPSWRWTDEMNRALDGEAGS